MPSLLLISIFALLLYSLFQLILKPLCFLLKIKLRYGERVYCHFFPLVGSLSLVHFSEHRNGKPYKDVVEIWKRHPKVQVLACAGLMYNEMAFVDPELIKQVCIDQQNDFKKVDFLIFVDYFLEEGMLFTYREKWKRQRVQVSQEFTFQHFKDKYPMIRDVARHFLQQYRDKVHNIAQPKDFSLSQFLMRITGEVLLRGFMGQDGKETLYFDDAKTILLSEELVQLIFEIAEQALSVSQNIKLRFLGKGYWHRDWLLSEK